MKKSILGLILSLALILCSILLIVACGDDETSGDSSSSKNQSASTDKSKKPSGSTDSSEDDSGVDSSTDSSEDGSGVDSSTDSSGGDSSIDSSTDSSTGSDDVDDKPTDVLPDVITLLPINYSTMTYVGTSLKDFSAMFDEQSTLGDPKADVESGAFPSFPSSLVVMYDADGNGDITEKDKEHVYEVTIDLGADHFVECFYVFFDNVGYSITLEAGTPFAYEYTFTAESSVIGWTKIELGVNTHYVNVKFNNGKAPMEIMAYGKRTGPYDAVNTEPHEYKDFNYFLGINGNQSDRVSTLNCATYFRDYINWLWCFDRSVYPNNPGTTYTTTMSKDYDVRFQMLKDSGTNAVPCFMFRPDDFPTETLSDYMNPETYVMYGEFMFQSALRFGYNPENTKDMIKVLGLQKRFNRNVVSWIEAGNEPNGEGNDGFSPYELAAFTSTAYDGHCGTVIAPTGSGVGVINANANVKLAMAGLAGVSVPYVKAMSFWLKYNRADGQLGLDAFNVHTYCKKLITYNGYQVYVGVCPEIGKITQYVEQLCEWRDKYYPDTEVWLTEFGWDTNTSYATENACHPYADFTAREIQAMWLVRAYFMFAKVGVDRAAMYMAQDLGDEATSTGKYGTSGVISSSGEYKDSFYYIYTLRNKMGDMHFAEVIESGNENVWIYRFENNSGKSCYALWCPTMDDVRVNNYTLTIDGTTASLTEFANLHLEGISSDLKVTNGTVTVNVSERPILVFSE